MGTDHGSLSEVQHLPPLPSQEIQDEVWGFPAGEKKWLSHLSFTIEATLASHTTWATFYIIQPTTQSSGKELPLL